MHGSQKLRNQLMLPHISRHKQTWVWVNTYRYIFSGMNIHKSQLFWGLLGTRVLTHPHINISKHDHILLANMCNQSGDIKICQGLRVTARWFHSTHGTVHRRQAHWWSGQGA